MNDARLMAIQQGKPYWTSVFPQIEAWITNRPASTAASSEPVSEISSKAHRGDDFSTINQIVSTKGSVFDIFEMHESIRVTANMADLALLAAIAAMLTMVAAMLQTPGTIKNIRDI